MKDPSSDEILIEKGATIRAEKLERIRGLELEAPTTPKAMATIMSRFGGFKHLQGQLPPGLDIIRVERRMGLAKKPVQIARRSVTDKVLDIVYRHTA